MNEYNNMIQVVNEYQSYHNTKKTCIYMIVNYIKVKMSGFTWNEEELDLYLDLIKSVTEDKFNQNELLQVFLNVKSMELYTKNYYKGF